MRSIFFEWRAIASHELGAPASAVRADFDEAIVLASEDDRLKRNRAIFLEQIRAVAPLPHTKADSFEFPPTTSAADAQRQVREGLRSAA
jgi:hypothetical protein